MAKPNLKKSGRKLLMKALRVIRQRPDTFSMEDWIRHDESVKGKAPYCGTVACLAGHIVLAAGAPPQCDWGALSIKTLPARLRALARKVNDELYGDGWCDPVDVEVGRLAAHLVCADEMSRASLQNIFGLTGYRNNHKRLTARVKKWLRTGH